MSTELVLFYVLSAGAIVSAVCVVMPPMGRNPIHSALSLICSFFCLAGLYALMHAHLLAALQILVYAGAVMVLFTFVIMLLNLGDVELGEVELKPSKVIGGLLVLFLFGKVMTVLLTVSPTVVADMGLAQNAEFGGVRDVGRMLYTTFLVPFELISVLLLVAAVGAVVLAKRKLGDAPEEEEGR